MSLQSRNQPATFPGLPIREIVDTCRGFLCTISEEDILHPTAPRAQAIYSFWMTSILGLNMDDIVKASEAQLDLMDNPDIYREAMYIGVFQMAMNQLMVRAAIDDFSTKDLTQPDTTRLQKHLAGIINFYLFEQEQASEILIPLQSEDDDLAKREEELMRSNQELRDSIDARREARRLNAPRVEDAKAVIAKGAQELAVMRQQSADLFAQITAEQEKAKKIQKDVSEITQTLTNQTLEIKRLQGQIIQSPAKLRTTLKDLAQSVEKENEEVRRLEAKERQMGIKISSLQKYEGDLGQCIRILDDWAVDVARANEATKRYEEHFDLHESLQSELSDVEQKINLLKRRINNAKDELDRFNSKTERKRAATKERKKQLEEMHAQMLEQKRALDVQAASKNKDALELENSIRAIHVEVHAELDRGEREYKKIKEQVMLYSIKLNKALDSINELNSQPIDDLLR